MNEALRFRELPFARTAAEVGLAWVIGTSVAIVAYLAAEGKLADFSPMMIGGALGWFGLLLVPIFLVGWIPIAAIRYFLGPNIGTALFLATLVGVSIYCLMLPETKDPYGQAFFSILGATGVVWSIIVGLTILRSRLRFVRVP